MKWIAKVIRAIVMPNLNDWILIIERTYWRVLGMKHGRPLVVKAGVWLLTGVCNLQLTTAVLLGHSLLWGKWG